MPKKLFTAETARAAALRSVEVREAKRQQAALSAQEATPTEPAPLDYPARRLARVRSQLDRVDVMMMLEADPQKLDRLASAQLRLSEQERVLAGRPLPGQRRPGPERDASANPLAWLAAAIGPAPQGYREPVPPAALGEDGASPGTRAPGSPGNGHPADGEGGEASQLGE